jgi:hypothetical protein
VHFSAIVLRAEERVAAAQRALPERRWRIDDAPFRVIARVEKLLAATSLRSSRPSVSSAEGAVLLATPFIYETVLAAAETTLAAVGPVLDPAIDSGIGRRYPILAGIGCGLPERRIGSTSISNFSGTRLYRSRE